LTSICGYVELLLGGTAGELNDTQRECVEAVDRSSAKLGGLVETILDLSRIEGGIFDIVPEPTDLVRIANASAEAAAEKAREHNIEMLVCPQVDTLTIDSDPRRVCQVIEELLSNAIVHTPSGGLVQLEVSENGGNGGVVKVSDDGEGIPREHLARIFDKFHKVSDGATQDSNGVGLGLSITKAIVERLGGAITVESSLGHGTTFTVSLPALPP
jgi:signal transduction histidine kinase